MVTVAIAACARSLALLGRCNDMTLETIAYFFRRRGLSVGDVYGGERWPGFRWASPVTGE